MDRKTGIRLRHLEGEPDKNNQKDFSPNIAPRNQSPMNRRKIFPNQQQTQSLITKPQNIKRNQPYPIEQSPNLMRNYQKDQTIRNYDESEVERLIDSLKKKSFEVEKKDQVIVKLCSEIEYLRNQNLQCKREIQILKTQIASQKLVNMSFPNLNIYDNSTKQNPSKNSQLYSGQKNPKEPIVHVKLNPSRISNDYGGTQDKIQEIPSEADSLGYEYLSPFMVLNHNKPNTGKNIQKKASHEVLNNGSKYSRQDVYRLQQKPKSQFYESNQYLPGQKIVNYPTKNKLAVNSERFSDVNQINQATNSNYTAINQYKEGKFEQSNRRGSNSIKNYPTFGEVNQQIDRNSNRPLHIQDSKQFKFEDFDFSELDNSAAQSQF